MWVIPGCLNRVLELSTWKAVQNPPLNNTISYCSKSANRPQTERRSSIQQQKQRRWWIGLDWKGSPVGRPKVKQVVGRGILAPWRRSWLLGLAVAATHRIGRHRPTSTSVPTHFSFTAHRGAKAKPRLSLESETPKTQNPTNRFFVWFCTSSLLPRDWALSWRVRLV